MVFFFDITKTVSEYDKAIPQSQTADKPRHREEEQHNNHETPGRQKSKPTNILFPNEMIAKLDTKK